MDSAETLYEYLRGDMDNDEFVLLYHDIREGASLRFAPGRVSIPEEFPKLDLDTLSKEMQLVVEIARSIYEEWLLEIAVIQDEQPRLLLIFKANIPEKAGTLRLNLGKLATEITNGLSPDVLRQYLNVLA